MLIVYPTNERYSLEPRWMLKGAPMYIGYLYIWGLYYMLPKDPSVTIIVPYRERVYVGNTLAGVSLHDSSL